MRGAVAVVLGAAVIAGFGCGGEGSEPDSDSRLDQSDDVKLVRVNIVEEQIRQGELPPVTSELFRLDGSVDLRAIGGSRGDHAVVRTESNGRRGPKLRWDLDQNGRIDPEEREITVRELYDATLPAYDEAQRRVASGEGDPGEMSAVGRRT